MKVSVPHPLAGTVDLVASPMRFSGTPVEYDRAPPTLGQDTDSVLGGLGLDAERLADLREKGII
jgi:crotonobetainyl-CoA:carnitine CoA-transferase CaiB-like acyl-CoA transferase